MSAAITVVGLGTGDENQLTLGSWNLIRQAAIVYLRTEHHPVVKFLKENGVLFQSFDSIYEEKDSFDEVYEEIASRLIQAAGQADGPIVYAVPGHPSVAERTTRLLEQKGREAGVEINCLGGESFLDQAFLKFGFDPIDGFQLLDGTDLIMEQINPALHTLIAQVYDSFTASDAKLALMEWYPDDYPVYIGHALGVRGEEVILQVPLYELDRVEGYGNLSIIWVPAVQQQELRHRSFQRAVDIVAALRSPGGCPWDQEQTHASIRSNLIEETYEVIETIDNNDPEAMCEELGDLLLQVLMHARMEEEAGMFTVRDVIQGLNDKLVRRHPHVFGDHAASNAEEALGRWDAIKQEEKRSKGENLEELSVLAGIPPALPSLNMAFKLQKKAAKVGFDWDDADQVVDKLLEEVQELRQEINQQHKEKQREEMGDLLFSAVNLARFLKIDPEEALSAANRKFRQRFEYMERKLRLKGQKIDQTDLQEMEDYWQEAKKVLENLK
ncbi:bifunctional methyltransferase/pyrophosphohydrolase YabN [Paenibacillus senegalensis]|uniref:nucleoside triphosphate pyrophosphohydrolase n=1 Tax=Paenibacillus senegalensis TaxID=1465766 RepID=UPI000289E95D|nr:nucleoside triphosphate pyrophosphohydrolase [Paenibacillus senegalensis]